MKLSMSGERNENTLHFVWTKTPVLMAFIFEKIEIVTYGVIKT